MKNILNIIKSVFENKLNRIEKSIPNKLSDLDNDLFYSNATEQLHITLSDLTEYADGGASYAYEYLSEQPLNYLRDLDKVKFTGSFSCSDGIVHNFTSDDGTLGESRRDWNNGAIYIEIGSIYKYINIWQYNNSQLTSFDLTIYSLKGKAIPANVVEKMTGATSTTNGTSGVVPAPKAGQQDFVLFGDGKYKSLPQSDYTQNDERATDYIKNRPFYTYIEERENSVLGVVPVEGTQRVNISGYDDNFWLSANKENSISLKVRTSDTDVKEVVLQKRYAPSYVLSEYSTDYWGNGSLITGSLSNTGEDIAIYYAGGNSYTILDGDRIGVWMRNYPVGQYVELSGVQDVEVVKTIDKKYLPSNIESVENKITSLSAESTDDQYPSATAVYDFVNTQLGDIKTLIDGV